jgi:membrane protease YdiL (CAAX protease family)
LWAFAVQTNPWIAALLSSLVFGLGHVYQGWRGVLRTALIGCVLAIAFVLTHSLWWLMMAHMAVNLLGGLFAWRRLRAPGSRPLA